jgi:hypothetical protein
MASSFLHGREYPQKIPAPYLGNVFSGIATLQQFRGYFGEISHAGAVGQATAPVKVTSNADMVDANQFNHMVDVINCLCY